MILSQIKFVAYVASSIDGRIARDEKSRSESWTSCEDWKFFQESLMRFDAVVVGFNTYKVAEKKLKKRNTIVFTSRLKEPKKVGTVTFLNTRYSDVSDFFKKTKYKKVAILGGPRVYDFFLKNKMLHELFVTIEPLVFGAGVPMFTGEKFTKYSFKLEFVKKLNKNGTILLKYKYANKSY